VTVPWEKVRNDIAVVIPVPKDKRSLFVVPWGPRPDGTFTHTYVGTTDTDYRGPVDDPQCTKDDIDYVLRALNASVTTGVTAADVTGVWAGLRPLVKQVNASDGTGLGGKAARTADLSRRHLVHRGESGIITVTGGKLTTYREMAQDTVDTALESLPGTSAGRCRTKRLKLRGAMRPRTDGSLDAHLESRYGGDAHLIRELIAARPNLAEPLVHGLPYVRAEAIHAFTHEMATTLDDVLVRRTRGLLFDRDATLAAARSVAELVAPVAGWDAARIDAEVAAFVEICAHESTAALVTESEMYP
jgi:glycerol-3-phosphate dehydrogenase